MRMSELLHIQIPSMVDTGPARSAEPGEKRGLSKMKPIHKHALLLSRLFGAKRGLLSQLLHAELAD